MFERRTPGAIIGDIRGLSWHDASLKLSASEATILALGAQSPYYQAMGLDIAMREFRGSDVPEVWKAFETVLFALPHKFQTAQRLGALFRGAGAAGITEIRDRAHKAREFLRKNGFEHLPENTAVAQALIQAKNPPKKQRRKKFKAARSLEVASQTETIPEPANDLLLAA